VQSALEHIEGEIIVVDNNSQDDSCEMMKQRFPNVKLIENKDNSGFPKGNNTGVAIAKENTFASSILIPWLPKILYKVLAFAERQKT
jgi:GT2 family glycosyltransferase